VAVIGEPGVGKSRLVYEFVQALRGPGWLVLESTSVSYGKATSYFPVMELLKRYMHIEDGDEPRTIRAKVTGHLLTLDEVLQETIPALLALLEALPADSPFLTLDPPQRRQRTLAALSRVLLRESQVQPLLLEGEVWGQAVGYCRQAGVKAVARSANREAVAYMEQALAALQHLPESQATLEQAIDLRLDLRTALFVLGELAQTREQLREAEGLAERLHDQRRLGQVSVYMMQQFRQIGDCNRAIACGQRALTLAAAAGDPALQVAAQVCLGQAYHAMGGYRRAIDILRRTVASLSDDLIWARFGMVGLRSVGARTFLAWCLAELGAGYVYLRQGDFARAIAALERGLAICQAKHIPLLFRHLALPLGSAYALSGRVAEALPLLQQAVEQATAMQLRTWQSLRIGGLSEAYLLAGHLEEARQLAVDALDLSRQYAERGHEAWMLRLLGEIHAHRHPRDTAEAEVSYHQALGLTEELGMRPLMAHCHHGLGSLYAKIGRYAGARAALSAAIELYCAMEMTYWLPQAEATLAQVEGR
jgi:tetratricopeptide (TPR) repeat protein